MSPFVKACCLSLPLTLAACDSSDLLAPSDVAGTYVLRTAIDLSAGLPTAGVLHLRPDGQVERRLTFEGSTNPHELVTIGRYRIRNAVLEIAFWPDGAEIGDQYYRPVGFQPDYITLTYGQPADGPDTVEVYQRVTVLAQ